MNFKHVWNVVSRGDKPNHEVYTSKRLNIEHNVITEFELLIQFQNFTEKTKKGKLW